MSVEHTANIQRIRDSIAQVSQAQQTLARCTAGAVSAIVEAMAERAVQATDRLARREAAATGMGRVTSKIARQLFIIERCREIARLTKAAGLLGQEAKSQVCEVAQPLGVILSFLPATTPVATMVFESLMALQARNAIVFVPARQTHCAVAEACETMQAAAVAAGAPANCLGLLDGEEENFADMLASRDIHFVLATGPAKLLQQVSSAGKPAVTIGCGNTPAYIDRSAHIGHAVRCLLQSKQMDWGVAEAAEECLLLDAAVAAETLAEFRRQGAYVLSEAETTQLAAVFDQRRRGLAGQPPYYVAAAAGLRVPVETTLLLAPVDGVASPLAAPKLSSLLSCHVVKGWEDACRQSRQLIALGHPGCVAVVHAMQRDVILEFAAIKEISRLLVNAPGSQGAIGMATALSPSLLLAGGSEAGSVTSDNLTVRNFMQLRRVAAIHEQFKLWGESRPVEPALAKLQLSEPSAVKEKKTTDDKAAAKPDPWGQQKSPRPPSFYLKPEKRGWPWKP